MEGASLELIELYDALERQPSSVGIHESILKLWIRLGDNGTKSPFVTSSFLEPDSSDGSLQMRHRELRLIL
jgi:hypothetical protein